MIEGQVVSGTIESIVKTHFIVDLEDGYKGLVHISEVSDYYVASLNSMFKMGHEYDFLVLSVDENEKRVKLSWKRIVPRFQKDPFKFELKETEIGFKQLQQNTKKEVEND